MVINMTARRRLRLHALRAIVEPTPVPPPIQCIVAPRTGQHLVVVRDASPGVDPVPVACCQCDALLELPRSGQPVTCQGCGLTHRFLDIKADLIV